MQQFTVPQFIDVEDKIFGPITVRQFLIILVAFMVSVVTYRLADFALFITLTILYFVIAGIIAFLKINGRPFHYFILNFIQTLKKPKIRVWNNKLSKTDKELKDLPEEEFKQMAKIQRKPLYAKSKLAEVALMVDTGGVYAGGDNDIKNNA